MICPPCKTAGRALTVGLHPSIAPELHAKCRGGTWCDCQHATESALNLKLVKR